MTKHNENKPLWCHCQYLTTQHGRSLNGRWLQCRNHPSHKAHFCATPTRNRALFTQSTRSLRHARWGQARPTFTCALISCSGRSTQTMSDVTCTFGPSSHRTQSTSQQAHAQNGTNCCQWECSHSLQATSKGLHNNLPANVLARPVWTGPNEGPTCFCKTSWLNSFAFCAQKYLTGFSVKLNLNLATCQDEHSFRAKL